MSTTQSPCPKITLAKFLEAVRCAEHVAMAPCSGLAYGIQKEFAGKWASESLHRADGCRQRMHCSINQGGALIMCGVPHTEPGALEVVP